jgi:hypothetical protein
VFTHTAHSARVHPRECNDGNRRGGLRGKRRGGVRKVMCRIDRRRNPRSPSAQRHAHDEQRHQRCHHLAQVTLREAAPPVTQSKAPDPLIAIDIGYEDEWARNNFWRDAQSCFCSCSVASLSASLPLHPCKRGVAANEEDFLRMRKTSVSDARNAKPLNKKRPQGGTGTAAPA